MLTTVIGTDICLIISLARFHSNERKRRGRLHSMNATPLSLISVCSRASVRQLHQQKKQNLPLKSMADVVTASYETTEEFNQDKESCDKHRDFEVKIQRKDQQSYLSALKDSVDSLKEQVNKFLTTVVEESKVRSTAQSEDLKTKQSSKGSETTPKKLKSS